MPNPIHRLIALVALAAIPWLAGCEFITYKPKGESPLIPLELTDDRAELDVVFVRFPAGDAEMNGPLWNDVNEQALPAALRSALAANGLRRRDRGAGASDSGPQAVRRRRPAVADGRGSEA